MTQKVVWDNMADLKIMKRSYLFMLAISSNKFKPYLCFIIQNAYLKSSLWENIPFRKILLLQRTKQFTLQIK